MMKKLLSLVFAVCFAASAYGQNQGTVTNHAYAIGKGPGVTGFSSLLCGATQLAVGQAAANPICRTIAGDWTIDAAGNSTLASVNGNVGTFGNASQCVTITVDAKGRITAASQQACAGGGGGAPGGTPGQVQFNSAGAFGGFTVAGDATLNTGTGALTLASTIAAGGPAGSATVAPIITWDLKGRLTAVTSATITPAIASVTGLGTGVATALGVNVGTAGAFVANGGALGTPSSGVGTNLTGIPYAALPSLAANQLLGALTATTPSGQSVPSCSTAASALQWTSGTGFACNTAIAAATVTTNANLTGAVTSSGNATSLGSFSSASLAGALTDETGSGAAVFGTAPTFATSITDPLVIGGTAVGSSLELRSTSGAGTTDFTKFTTGSNGATEAMRVVHSGNVAIGSTTGSNKLNVGTDLGVIPGMNTAFTVGDGAANAGFFVGQDASHGIQIKWDFNAVPGSAVSEIGTFANNNGIAFAGSFLSFNSPASFSSTGTFSSSLLGNNAASTLGFTAGSGGTVTQATSKATGVTLSKVTGQITMNAAALAAGSIVSFVLTDTIIAATDVLILNHISGGTVGSYLLNAQAAGGSATINVRNTSAASLSEAIVIQFVVIKGATT